MESHKWPSRAPNSVLVQRWLTYLPMITFTILGVGSIIALGSRWFVVALSRSYRCSQHHRRISA
jgi:hypothetical protein